MKKPRLIIRLVTDLILLIPYVFSVIVPRRKNIWVFGAWFGNRCTDSPRYLYEYVCKNEPSVRAVWLTRRRDIVDKLRGEGREAYLISSLAGFWICCRASLAFMNCGLADLNRTAVYPARKIQLWHGTPLKKIKLDDHFYDNPPRSLPSRIIRTIWKTVFPFEVERADMLISPSKDISPRLAGAFGVSASQVKVTGYPRGDVILSPDPEPVPIIEELKSRLNARRVLCYLPTHRGEGRHSFDVFAGLDISALNECLARHDAIMLVKMHYFHRESMPETSGANNSRIWWLSEAEMPDVNLALPHIDLLITDYSSVYFDYLLLDRPIIFTPFDKDQYVKTDRELYDDYDAVTPGPKCMDWLEVIRNVEQLFEGRDEHKEMRKLLRPCYNTFEDTDNCKRVIEAAKELLC